jgi:hypothetical protein
VLSRPLLARTHGLSGGLGRLPAAELNPASQRTPAVAVSVAVGERGEGVPGLIGTPAACRYWT